MGQLGEEVYMSRFMTERFCGEFVLYLFPASIQPFLPDFMQQHILAPNCNDGAVSAMHPALFLRKWAQAKLTNGTWKDALCPAVSMSISLDYCTLAGLTLCLLYSLRTLG